MICKLTSLVKSYSWRSHDGPILILRAACLLTVKQWSGVFRPLVADWWCRSSCTSRKSSWGIKNRMTRNQNRHKLILLTSPWFCMPNVPSSLQSERFSFDMKIELECLLLSGLSRVLDFTFTYRRCDCSLTEINDKMRKWMTSASPYCYLHKN